MRKAQALIAILALSRGRAVSRTDLQSALWADSPVAQQQTNLRQALAHIRRQVGPEFLLATRDVCRFNPAISLTCDATESDSAATRSLLPDFPETWFEQHRHTTGSHLSTPGTQIFDGLLALLQWYAHRDPAKAIAVMRDHADLIDGISYRELPPLVELGIKAIPVSEPLYGWGLFWKAHCVGNSQNLAASEPILTDAFEQGVFHEDTTLQIRSGIALAVTKALGGKIMTAQRVLNRIDPLATRADASLRARYLCSRGAVLHHAGQPEEGIEFIRMAAAMNGISSAEAAHFQALMAVFLSSSAARGKVLGLLHEPERIARETGNRAVPLLTALTVGQVHLNESSPESAARIFRDLAKQAKAAQSSHLELYARESLALATLRIGDRESAVGEVRFANRRRVALGLGFTPWDKRRLSELSQP